MQTIKTGIDKIEESETQKENIKNVSNSRVYRLFKIRDIVHDNGACLVCIRRKSGRIRKYHTYC